MGWGSPAPVPMAHGPWPMGLGPWAMGPGPPSPCTVLYRPGPMAQGPYTLYIQGLGPAGTPSHAYIGRGDPQNGHFGPSGVQNGQNRSKPVKTGQNRSKPLKSSYRTVICQKRSKRSKRNGPDRSIPAHRKYSKRNLSPPKPVLTPFGGLGPKWPKRQNR